MLLGQQPGRGGKHRAKSRHLAVTTARQHRKDIVLPDAEGFPISRDVDALRRSVGQRMSDEVGLDAVVFEKRLLERQQAKHTIGGRPDLLQILALVAMEPPVSFDADQIRNIKNAYRLVYRKGLKLAEAVDEIAALLPTQPELGLMLDSLRASERGLIR